MKKLITILTIMIVLVGAVFAVDGVTGANLIITSTIAQVTPQFKLFGSIDSNYGTEATISGTTLVSNKNIATESIAVNIKVVQTNTSYFESDSGFEVTVTATPFYKSGTAKVAGDNLTAATATQKSGKPAASSVANGADVDTNTDSTNDFVHVTDGYPKTTTYDTTDERVTFKVQYPTGVRVVGTDSNASAVEVGHATFTWTAVPTLEVGNYSATITVAYTAE